MKIDFVEILYFMVHVLPILMWKNLATPFKALISFGIILNTTCVDLWSSYELRLIQLVL